MTMLISSGVAGAQSPAACGVIAAGRAAIPPSSGLGPSSFALSADGATLAFADPDGRTLVVLHGLLPHYSAPKRSAVSRMAYTLHVTDEITGAQWEWHQQVYVRLDPFQHVAHVVRVHP